MPEENHFCEISHVTIKAPAFHPESASGFFKVIEAQFHLQNITKSSTKFFHVLGNIPSDVAYKTSDETMNEHDYDKLKSEIIGCYYRAKPELIVTVKKN